MIAVEERVNIRPRFLVETIQIELSLEGGVLAVAEVLRQCF